MGAALRDFRFVHGLGDGATLDEATSAALADRWRLSPTVADILRKQPGETSALGLVAYVLERHQEYPGTFSTSSARGEVGRPVREWLALVRAV